MPSNVHIFQKIEAIRDICNIFILVKNKNMLRTFWASKWLLNKNVEPQIKFRRSYKKKCILSKAAIFLGYKGTLGPERLISGPFAKSLTICYWSGMIPDLSYNIISSFYCQYKALKPLEPCNNTNWWYIGDQKLRIQWKSTLILDLL